MTEKHVKKQPMQIPTLHQRDWHDGLMYSEVVYNCDTGIAITNRAAEPIGQMQVVIFAQPLDDGYGLRGGIYGPEFKVVGDFDYLPHFALISLYKEMSDMPNIEVSKLNLTIGYLLAYLRQYAQFYKKDLLAQWGVFQIDFTKARIERPELWYAETRSELPKVLWTHPFFKDMEF